MVDDRRYLVCLNDRQAIIEALQEKLKSNLKSLVGNKGYRKYLSMDRDTILLNGQKIEEEKRFDGKWVRKTNTDLSAKQVPSSTRSSGRWNRSSGI